MILVNLLSSYRPSQLHSKFSLVFLETNEHIANPMVPQPFQSILKCKPYHIPLKYRRPINKNDHIRPIRLTSLQDYDEQRYILSKHLQISPHRVGSKIETIQQ